MEHAKQCWFCKLSKLYTDFGRNPGCKDGLNHFCVDCWNNFYVPNDGENSLKCLKCNMLKPLSEFYRVHGIGAYGPWCNSCRDMFIGKHVSSKPPKLPKPPRRYICSKCREKKDISEFSQTPNGIRSQKCNQCCEKIANKTLAKKKFAEAEQQRKESPRHKRHLHRLQNTGTQICNNCNIEKPLTEFNKDSSELLGVHGTCKICRQLKAKQKLDKQKMGIPANYFRCTKCKTVKPVAEFTKNLQKKRGYDFWCKECSKERKRKWNRAEPWEKKIIHGCRSRASKKGVPFNMKPEDLYDHTGSLPIFCPIFPDTRLDYKAGPNHRAWASVDRKIPALGYVSDNVWVVSMAANTWKSNGGSEKDKIIIKKLMRNNNKTKTLYNSTQISLFE